MGKIVLLRPHLKLNLKVVRPSNFANPSRFDKVMEIAKKTTSQIPTFEAKAG